MNDKEEQGLMWKLWYNIMEADTTFVYSYMDTSCIKRKLKGTENIIASAIKDMWPTIMEHYTKWFHLVEIKRI